MNNSFLRANDGRFDITNMSGKLRNLSDQYIPTYGLKTPMSGLLPVYFRILSIKENVF